jgi:hypothetical protein
MLNMAWERGAVVGDAKKKIGVHTSQSISPTRSFIFPDLYIINLPTIWLSHHFISKPCYHMPQQ